ncbi:hypothetical protein IAT38_007802 [Cryptococcus sp. DSM 104549]
MSGRLASLNTPKGARSRASPSPSPAPSLSLQTETTYHRRIKLVLGELRKVIKAWDEIVKQDAYSALQGCVNEMTEMDNIVSIDERPERPEIGSHLADLYKNRVALRVALNKLDTRLGKLHACADQADSVLFEASQKQPQEFFSEPLFFTWTLEQIVNSISTIVSLHTIHLADLSVLADIILDPATSFDDAKLTIESWFDLATSGERWDGVREWEDLVDLELSKGGEEEEEQDDEDEPVKSRKKRR